MGHCSLLLVALITLSACNISKKANESEVGTAGHQEPRVSIEVVERFVNQQLILEPAPLDKLYSFSSLCLDVSGQWIRLMRREGLNGVLQESSGVAYISAGGKSVQRSPTHFFIAFNPQTPEEIILDASYVQFFENGEKSGLPPVLISRTADIKKIFAQHATKLRLITAEDLETGKYNPNEAAELIYSTGAFQRNRKSFD